MRSGIQNPIGSEKAVEVKSDDLRCAKAMRVTKLALLTNIVLTTFKFFAGVVGNSAAMVADAVHSLSDMLTDVAVMVGFKLSQKPRDSTHNYGHGKIETLSAGFVGLVLFLVGLEIFYSGLEKVLAFFGGEILQAPGWIAVFAAVASILSKESLYRYTIRHSRELESDALEANAWHQRSDAMSSVGTMLGSGGAILLGGRWAVLDPLAALILSFFILKVAFDIFYRSINELLEASLGSDVNEEIEKIIRCTDGVLDCHKLKTRKIGSAIAVDVHIEVDRGLNIVDAHQISSHVENKLRGTYGGNSHLSIHVEPHPGNTDF
ncbi:cation transporter [Methanosarcina sp. KYL-1]|uniref:cation diffusion facilitator family transporter n=1 Tax=Methanosarcina sp. KYL-1 TaxID=2602068 RepID=UPI0021007DBA|nr:cation diffusion facilitator family transporter [Methanosarcina sp. KYL-1]MCQ1536282.1 cation transporter [Methanosarcina sp. KYL-1]